MYQRLPQMKNALLRTNSICSTAESDLLEYVLNNETDNIRRLIENNAQVVTYVYPDYNKPILHIACSEDGVTAKTVKTLVESGADLHYADEEDWEAIHCAACKTDNATLRAVINGLKKSGDINVLANGSNALHILIKHGKRDESPEEFFECAKLLVGKGINVNQADSRLLSPILIAAKKGYADVVALIINSKVVPVDLDTHQSEKKTARDIIVKEQLYDGPLPARIKYNTESDIDVLFKNLQTGNENAFVNYKNGDIFDLVDKDNGLYTMLQICCEKGLRKAAVHLLDKGANPNLTTLKTRHTPIEMTADRGYYEIFGELLNQPKIEIPKKLLTTLLMYYDNEKFTGIDHSKCYAYLLKRLETDKILLHINEQNESTNSPLHYALRYANQATVEELLDKGASLGSKNKFGTMPIHDIEPDLLEKHLDRCVKFDLKGKKFDKEDFCVTFDYRTLIPPGSKIELNVSYDNNDSEMNFNHTMKQDLVEETEVISYMSEAPEFKHLLKHPVITSFLFMKWHRIRWLFYINLAFYIAFFASLVVYIFTYYANFNESEKPTLLKALIYLSWIVLLITYFILIIRESFQIAVSPKNYFKNFENYIELVLVCITGAVLFIEMPSYDTRKQLSSISILLAAFELVLMLGQHPKLSTNVVMLRTVSFNFFKFFAWYSLLIVAFAMSFYILFTETEDASKNETKSEDEEEDFFTDPGKSVFKTLVMLTGEFDAGSLNFHRFPIVSKIIFALFIFMIAIILLNLLNGLAVSDTQMIKNNAELVGHIARAKHISYVESMLLGNILPRNVITKMNQLCCCFPADPQWNLTILKPLAKRACLFPHFLDYELTIYPNKEGQVAIYDKKHTWDQCCLGCRYIYLDKQTIRRTNAIVQSKRDELKSNQEITYLQKVEEVIIKLNEKLNTERSEVFLLNKKLDQIIRHLSQEEISAPTNDLNVN